MRYVKAQAPAKVNLALRVGSARPDGFHPLDTVFEALNLYETLEAWNDPSGRLSLEFSSEGFGFSLPVDESNLAIRAGMLLKERYGAVDGGDGDDRESGKCALRGARMKILKRIPIAGGMAGGSADAAAALVALNELWELGLSRDELMELGAELGSDVPFALMGGIAHGRGRGEKLVSIVEGARHTSPLESYSHGFVMLINPQGLSTPAVFREFDRIRQQQIDARRSENVRNDSLRVDASVGPLSTLDLRSALEAGRLDDVAAHMINDLETPAFSLRPDLKKIVLQLRSEIKEGSLGAQAAILSGSGPTIALLCHPRHAEKIRDQLQTRYPELLVVTAYGPVPRASTTSKIS